MKNSLETCVVVAFYLIFELNFIYREGARDSKLRVALKSLAWPSFDIEALNKLMEFSRADAILSHSLSLSLSRRIDKSNIYWHFGPRATYSPACDSAAERIGGAKKRNCSHPPRDLPFALHNIRTLVFGTQDLIKRKWVRGSVMRTKHARDELVILSPASFILLIRELFHRCL